MYLKSNVNLHLDSGAILKGSDKLEDYPLERDGSIGGNQDALLELNTGETTVSGESDRAGVITAYKARNVSITGHDIPGFYCNYVNDLELNGFSVEWADDLPDFCQGIIQVLLSPLSI